jgi:spore photoproduct lyase
MISTPFDSVVVDLEVADLPFTRSFLGRLPTQVAVRARDPRDPLPRGRRIAHVTREPGAFVKPCPCSPGVVGCGYWVLTPVFQCPYACTYCFLRFYAPDAPLTLLANLEDAESQFLDLAKSRGAPLRVGTGEFADSLALDPWTAHSRWLRELVAAHPAVTLELKTKSANIEGLLDGSPSPGYRVGFHLDPIILETGWEDAYDELTRLLFEAVTPDRVAWVSLGTLRFPPRFLEQWGPALRGRRIFFGEFVPGPDGKLRYFWPLRREVYRRVARALRRRGGPNLPVYLCMEPRSMWLSSLGWAPDESDVETSLLEETVDCN